MKYNILLLLTVFSLITLVPASPYSSSIGVSPYSSNINQEVVINYSTIPTVNNSQYLQGYTPLTLRNWMEDHFDLVYASITALANYLPLSGGTMAGDIDMNGNDILDVNNLNGSGTLNWTGTTWLTTGNTFVRDIDDSTHHLNVDLENLDRLYANVFLTPLDIETFYNATGDYINITAGKDDTIIAVALSEGNNAQIYRLQYTNIILPLTAGTNETPVLNRVYVKLVAGVPTWEVSITNPTVTHAMASRVLLGDSGTTPYSASLQEDGQRGFLKRVQRTNRIRGLLYKDGFDYTATATDLEIRNGTYINGIYDGSMLNSVNITEGFYLVHIDGSYHWYDSFDDIIYYSNGELIGNNKYFNVVFGITPFDGDGNIYAVVQDEPTTEYTSVSLAYGDSENTLAVYPSEDFLKIFFLPVARMILNEGGGAEILPNGMYAIDYRGGVAGGVSSGGGLTEQDPVWTLDKPNYWKSDGSSTATGNWSLGSYNISASYFIGDGSQLKDVNFTEVDPLSLHLDGSTPMQGNANMGGNNITNALYGFFSYLGSSISRVTKGWFVDLDVNGTATITNINVTNNLTVGNFTFTTEGDYLVIR